MNEWGVTDDRQTNITKTRRFPWCNVIDDTYCSPAWSGLTKYTSIFGLTSAQDRARIDAFLRRSKRYGYCADSVPLITDIFAEADQSLFRRILNNECHVLHQLLPDKTNCTYNLRSWQHDRQLTRKSTVMTHCFLSECYKKTHIDDLGLYLYFHLFSLRFVNVLYPNIRIWIRIWICVEWSNDHFGIGLTQINPSLTNSRNLFIFLPVTSTLLTWNGFSRFLITRVYDATKFELTTAVQFTQADGRTKICAKNDSYVFVLCDFDLDPLIFWSQKSITTY